MKLLSMTDFVLGINYNNPLTEPYNEILIKIHKYAKFLKQPLKLEMFVPVSSEGEVMTDPKEMLWPSSMSYAQRIADYEIEYKLAKEKVLFEGLKVKQNFRKDNYYIIRKNDISIWLSWNKSKTIEDIIHNDLTLTPSAIKQFNLK